MHAFKKSGYGRILVGAEPTFISTASYMESTHICWDTETFQLSFN